MHDGSLWFRWTLCVLATWRLSHLVAHEDGPFDVIVRLRARAGGGSLGRLMDCPYCLSLWIAAPAALLLADRLADGCVAWLAISGGSSLLEKLFRSVGEPPATTVLPKGAYENVMLWTETSNIDDSKPAHNPRTPPGPRV
jgi:hypothetical protein